MINKGAPAKEVMTPTGSSDGLIALRAIRSLRATITPPPTIDTGRRLRCLGPTINLMIWGTINPTNPIIPKKATVIEVEIVQRSKNKILIPLIFIPIVIAVVLSTRRRSSSRVKKNIGTIPMSEVTLKILTLLQEEAAKLPIVHCMIFCS